MPDVLSFEEFEYRVRELFSLSDDWFAGRIGAAERDAKERALLMGGDGWFVRCAEGHDDAARRRAGLLTAEFARAVGYAGAIGEAIAEMKDAGFGDDASAMVRAHYFAKHWLGPENGTAHLPPAALLAPPL